MKTKNKTDRKPGKRHVVHQRTRGANNAQQHRRPRPESEESCLCLRNTGITLRNGAVGVYNGYITTAEYVACLLGFSA